MGERPIGYVVVTYNQAGGLPELDGDVHWELEDACTEMNHAVQETARVGRRERYAIAELVPIDEED